MKALPLLFATALLGLVVSAPAQQPGGFGRHARGPVAVQHGGHLHHGFGRLPVPVLRAPLPPRGHWETRMQQVLVPGYWQEQQLPPTYGWVFDGCGNRRWGIVAQGGCTRVRIPARWENRATRVWVGGAAFACNAR